MKSVDNGSGPTNNNPPSVIELSKSARQKLKARRYQEAKDLFRAGLEREPENPYLLSGMGDACRETNDFEGAERCYRELLKVDGKNLFALRGLGDVYKRLNRHQDAIKLWETYLKFRPQDKHVMTRIADSCKVLALYDRAEQAYRQILKIAPHDRFAMTGLADLQHRMGFDDRAIETYEKILSQDPNELHILTIIGKLCWRISDFERAEKYFRHALTVDPKNPYALYGLGNCFRWYRQYEKAIEIWQRILEDSEGTQTLHTRMGDAYFHLDRLEAAYACYKRALEFDPEPFSLAAFVCLCSVQKKLDEGARYFRRLMDLTPHPEEQLETLTKRFIRSDQSAEMKELFAYLINSGDLPDSLVSILQKKLEA